ncbi:MAG TPA: hypothetical protein ENK11_07545 [Phycisphaerales bacterium]|nr:hypothetical protein [Phycisphaerales bacterium]
MIPAASLLQLLGSGVGLIGRIASGAKPVEDATFAELLERAAGGTLRSGEPVRVEPGSGVELTAEQLERVRFAADRLDAAGASEGVILIDDLALKYDVLTRSITGLADLQEGVSGIDAVVRAPGVDTEGGTVTVPPGGLSNAALLRLLASRRGGA